MSATAVRMKTLFRRTAGFQKETDDLFRVRTHACSPRAEIIIRISHVLPMVFRHMRFRCDRITLADLFPWMDRDPVAVKEGLYRVTGYADADLFTDQIIRDGIFV